MPHRIQLTPKANQHFNALSARDRAIVRDEMNAQLAYEPTTITRKRKQMEPNALGYEWELRIGTIRIFYNMVGDVVSIEAIGRKQGNELYIGGKKVTL